MRRWIPQGKDLEQFPTIHVVSDSLGQTGQALARAAAAAFGVTNPALEVWSEPADAKELKEGLERHLNIHRETPEADDIFVLFYTVVDSEMRKVLKEFKAHEDVVAVDLMDEAINALADVSGRKPLGKKGAMRQTDEAYFSRIEAMEFTIEHDDGRRPEELTKADIVLIGVSRTSKTPLSIYLSQQGYKVANIPLDPLSEPPVQIYDVERTKLFGLMTSPDVLVDIRKRRLGNAVNVAGSYADREMVYQDLEKARALMRKLGCVVVRTDNRAIEETAQEILRYYATMNH